MNYDESKRLLRDTLDVLVPVVTVYLAFDGATREIYELINKFPSGSHLGQVVGATGAAVIYYWGYGGRNLRK